MYYTRVPEKNPEMLSGQFKTEQWGLRTHIQIPTSDSATNSFWDLGQINEPLALF